MLYACTTETSRAKKETSTEERTKPFDIIIATYIYEQHKNTTILRRKDTRLNNPRHESTSSSDRSLLSRPGHVAIMRHTRDASSEVSKVAIASGPSWRSNTDERKGILVRQRKYMANN